MRIDNQTDTFSYGDVLDAIDELDGCIMEADDGEGPCAADCDIDEHAEHAELIALLDQVSDSDSYFVRDSYFVKYAQELADDLCAARGALVRWPFTCIDWQEAADELQQDYYDVDFDGVTYWVGG